MGILSAQSFVQSVLDGMTPPGATGIRAPVKALITPKIPDVQADASARAYILPGKGPEKRLAFPRGSGRKKLTHQVQVFLVWMDSLDDPDADVNFPLLIDWTMDLLRASSPNPTMWTDPYTGRQSQMANLGENMTYEYVPPRTTVSQGMLRYDARITCPLLEIFTG